MGRGPAQLPLPQRDFACPPMGVAAAQPQLLVLSSLVYPAGVKKDPTVLKGFKTAKEQGLVTGFGPVLLCMTIYARTQRVPRPRCP